MPRVFIAGPAVPGVFIAGPAVPRVFIRAWQQRQRPGHSGSSPAPLQRFAEMQGNAGARPPCPSVSPCVPLRAAGSGRAGSRERLALRGSCSLPVASTPGLGEQRGLGARGKGQGLFEVRVWGCRPGMYL